MKLVLMTQETQFMKSEMLILIKSILFKKKQQKT
jgi:hypothetical protein